mgnify:CR=1 FL=1
MDMLFPVCVLSMNNVLSIIALVIVPWSRTLIRLFEVALLVPIEKSPWHLLPLLKAKDCSSNPQTTTLTAHQSHYIVTRGTNGKHILFHAHDNFIINMEPLIPKHMGVDHNGAHVDLHNRETWSPTLSATKPHFKLLLLPTYRPLHILCAVPS